MQKSTIIRLSGIFERHSTSFNDPKLHIQPNDTSQVERNVCQYHRYRRYFAIYQMIEEPSHTFNQKISTVMVNTGITDENYLQFFCFWYFKVSNQIHFLKFLKFLFSQAWSCDELEEDDCFGDWESIRNETSSNFILSNSSELSICGFDERRWGGQLLKISFGCGECMLVKVKGVVDYPANISEVFGERTTCSLTPTERTPSTTSITTTSASIPTIRSTLTSKSTPKSTTPITEATTTESSPPVTQSSHIGLILGLVVFALVICVVATFVFIKYRSRKRVAHHQVDELSSSVDPPTLD